MLVIPTGALFKAAHNIEPARVDQSLPRQPFPITKHAYLWIKIAKGALDPIQYYNDITEAISGSL